MTTPVPFEIIRPDIPRGAFKSVLFDFDGTLSLIREGWQRVMIPMMVEVLRRETPTAESDAELMTVVEEFVTRLTGKQTIYQMIRLAEEVRRRGGQPADPLYYKREYHTRLLTRIQNRLDDLSQGRATPEDWTVPGSHQLLEALRRRGLVLYLASGTDLVYVEREAELLRLADYFRPHIYGALDDYRRFSKRLVIERILREHNLRGEELLAFGDGFVEIEEVKKVGGVAVGVASDEVRRQGIDAWKRRRLIEAGADIIVPDYRHSAVWLPWLCDRADWPTPPAH